MLSRLIVIYLCLECFPCRLQTGNGPEKELSVEKESFSQLCKVLIEIHEEDPINVIIFDTGSQILTSVLHTLYAEVDNVLLSDWQHFDLASGLSLVILNGDASINEVTKTFESHSFVACSILFVLTSDSELEYETALRVMSYFRTDFVTAVWSYASNVGWVNVPHSSQQCTHDFCDAFRLDRTNHSRMNETLRHKITNMGRRPIKISAFERRFTFIVQDGVYTGFDGEMTNILQDNLKLKPVFTNRTDSAFYGFKDENGTFYGSLGDVVYHRSDISMNQVFLKDYKSDQVTFTTTIHSDKLCVIVPASKPIPNWKAIFLCFGKGVWSCILGVYSGASLFWHLLKKVSHPGLKQDRSKTVLLIYGVLVLHPLDKLPDNVSERLMLGAVMFSSLMLASSFQGSLLTLLSHQLYEKEMETLADLDASGLPIHTNSINLLDTFEGSGSKEIKSLQSKLTPFDDPSRDILDVLSKSRDMAALGRENELKIRIGSNYTKTGRSVVHIVEECPRSYHLTYLMPKASPFYRSVNAVLSRIVSSGITKSPKFNGVHLNMANRYKRHNLNDKVDPEVFTLENLKIAFALLLFGYVLSSLVLLIEFLFKCYK